MPGLRVLDALLTDTEGLNVRTVRGDGAWPEGPAMIDSADSVVLFVSAGAVWLNSDPERLAAFKRLAERGGGLVALHWAIGTKPADHIEPFVALFGGCHGGPDRRYTVVEETVTPADAAHPINSGIGTFRAHDEFYYRLKFVRPEGTIRPVLQVTLDDEPQTVAWSWERPDGGRSFGFSGLHFHANWQLPEYRRLVKQAVLWTNGLDVPRDGADVEIAPEALQLAGGE
jgi:type 1 glutamine amidotransferase